jgi:hypothetical protein
VLLVVTACGGTYEKELVVPTATRKHGFTASAPDDCEAGQRPVNALLGDGLAGEENAVYCSVAATPGAQRPQRISDQVREGNVFCVTHSARMHKRVVAALREFPR